MTKFHAEFPIFCATVQDLTPRGVTKSNWWGCT